MIEHGKRVRARVDADSNLYFDMGFDSVSYIDLVLKIENRYSVNISILEMEECLNVGRLISTVERKVRDRENG